MTLEEQDEELQRIARGPLPPMTNGEVTYELGWSRGPSSAEVEGPPSHYAETSLSMTNEDNEIDAGLEDALRTQNVVGWHFARNFCGRVWFDGKQFCERVKRYRVAVAVHRADTLPELMRQVNDRWGWQ